MRVFGLSASALAALRVESAAPSTPAAEARQSEGEALTLPDRPSIAVLPFDDMSIDRKREYFADGMVEDIITALSRFHNLFVIARNSSFAYKGRAVDVKHVGRELGVRYLVEGSVRRTVGKVRINAQLIDALTGAHLWADRFDGKPDHIFDLQDRVSERIVGAIAPRLLQAEIERVRRKPTKNLDAYDYCLRARASYHQWTREGTAEALRFAYEAIELDPDFVEAFGVAAQCYRFRWTSGWATSAEEKAEVKRLAVRAMQLGMEDADTLASIGFALASIVGDVEAGAALIDRALALNPNLAAAWLYSGVTRTFLGEPEVAISHIETAMRLSPLDRRLAAMQDGIARAHFLAGRYEEAACWAEKSLLNRHDFIPALRIAGASLALAGRLDDAQRAMARLLQHDPERRISNLNEVMPPFRPEARAKYAEGLRRAGLPE
jgi:adenylate cyclase